MKSKANLLNGLIALMGQRGPAGRSHLPVMRGGNIEQTAIISAPTTCAVKRAAPRRAYPEPIARAPQGVTKQQVFQWLKTLNQHMIPRGPFVHVGALCLNINTLARAQRSSSKNGSFPRATSRSSSELHAVQKVKLTLLPLLVEDLYVFVLPLVLGAPIT